MLDLLLVLAYFVGIFLLAIKGRTQGEVTAESYFLSDRNLRWHSIAVSTIATNVQGYQFLGMMGSAYLYGIAQANLEINAVQGMLIAALVFVPMYLRERVITITQFIEKRLGEPIALAYSLANLALFSTITLGAALFWGAYAANLVFADYLAILHPDPMIRTGILLVGLGVFSAIYTYLGGLAAVVRTDILQFGILLLGAIVVLLVAVHHLGGWQQLYIKTPEHMHLHLPADHEKLPWTMLFGLFFLNINYWCANQTIMQRSLAARSLQDAQIGLMVGGLIKYLMAVLIVVPGIALYGLLKDQPLSDPDLSFPYLVATYIPSGVKGIILCALFASLMSTIDSTFNSLATLWSVDIYKRYWRPNASDAAMVAAGRQTIIFTLFTGIGMGLLLLSLKYERPEAAFTHQLNELRYYVNCGIVVLICSAAVLLSPRTKITLLAFALTIPLNLWLKASYPEMNYFVRAGWVISLALIVSLLGGYRSQRGKWLLSFSELLPRPEKHIRNWAWGLLLSLLCLHIVFH